MPQLFTHNMVVCVYSVLDHHKHNWIKYLVIAYLPVAILYVYILVVLFRFNAMSPSVIAYIFVFQIISSPAFASIFTTFVYSVKSIPL